MICGAYGRGNAGDDAILSGIVQEMRAFDSDRPITVMSRRPKETKTCSIAPVQCIPSTCLPLCKSFGAGQRSISMAAAA